MYKQIFKFTKKNLIVLILNYNKNIYNAIFKLYLFKFFDYVTVTELIPLLLTDDVELVLVTATEKGR